MASQHDQILQLSGWTAEEIDDLAHDRTCPGEYFCDFQVEKCYINMCN